MPRQLSKKPSQIRNRLRRKTDKLDGELRLYYEVKGKPIEQWDLEELARGRPRASDGTFKGRTPRWITGAIQREAKRRLLDHTFGSMAGHVDLAITTIVNLLRSEEVDDFGKPLVDSKTKLAAATFIIENIIGKPKAIIEVENKDAVAGFLATALVLDDGQSAHPVIDGHFVDNDDDDDDDDEDYDDDDE